MPIKRVSSMTSISSQLKDSSVKMPGESIAVRMPSLANILVMITIIIFAISVSFRVSSSLEKKYAISDTEAKTCLMDFKTKACNPLGMSDECISIYRCIQKINDAELSEKILSLIYFAYLEVKENGFIPAIIIILILLFEIAKSMKAKEEPSENNRNQ